MVRKNSREELVVSLKGEAIVRGIGSRYATTSLTQFEILAGREWKILKRCHYAIPPVAFD